MPSPVRCGERGILTSLLEGNDPQVVSSDSGGRKTVFEPLSQIGATTSDFTCFQAFSQAFWPNKSCILGLPSSLHLVQRRAVPARTFGESEIHPTLCNFCQINSSRLSKVESRDCQISSLAASTRPGGCLRQSRLRKQPSLLSSFGQTDPILA